ncbi:guanine nucleotide exchange protein smcr8b [Betta splendens]|uniref:Guanine nucleotide exchange protein smcr8b n=1 Tax=Betta splendens TaxID=158456 RepID=A0A6P7M8U5_BETSP|nr:guanine nucleotide exchange protein smcr8b [Betta splendens]
MIGSPDLLAFTAAEGFGEGEEDRASPGPGLPEELSVPLVPVSNPWASRAQFHRDFILVAEFSEQVGPKPVLTVPDDPRVIGSFDLNHFSVRIMSVDYQASGPGPAASSPSSPGPRLSFSEDSKVLLGDSAEDAFAYVHYVTLYDLEARGMVRPFCMAYVCSNQDKLTENYSELLTCFTQASDSLKTGNRQAFSTELQRKLQELEYSRLTLLQDAEQARVENEGTDAEQAALELEAVELSILTHRDLLRQVTSYPNRKLKQPDFLPYDLADSLSPTGLLPPEPSPASAAAGSERCLKSLQELCNSYFLSLMKEQLADAERRLRGDRSALRTARVTRALSRSLKLTNFLFELWSPEDEEEGEVAEGGVPRATRGRSGVDVCQSEPLSLESFCSCVEEIPIKLEAPTGTETPDPGVAMEMAGSISSGDSIEVLGTEKSYRTQQVVAGCDIRAETPVGTTDATIRRVDARRPRACARRTNSEDSIEVLSTTESIFPDDLTAITEEEADEALEERKPNADESLQTSAGGDVLIREAIERLKKNHVHKDALKTSKQAEESVEMTPKGPVPPAAPPVPDLHVNLAPPLPPARDGQRPPPCGPLRLLSVDEASDCTSFNGSSDPPSPTQHVHGARPDRRRRRKAGLRALRFLKQNSFSQHAVFCLLSGRALVVLGADETLVRKMVDALSLFLPAPGPSGSAVMPGLTAPLQLSDLLSWRLIGVHRSASSASSSIIHSLTHYGRYLALLDLDQRTLRCPSYSGSLLDKLAYPYAICRGSTYLLHLESSLTMLANKALVFTFHPASQRPDAAGGREDADEQSFLLRSGYCSGEHDMRVMAFLSDLIKQHHAGRGPSVLRFSYSSVHLHRNTYTA